MLQATTAHMRMHPRKPYPQLWGDLMNGHRRTKRGCIAHVSLGGASLLWPKSPVRYRALCVALGAGSNGRLLSSGAPLRCLHHDANKNERTAGNHRHRGRLGEHGSRQQPTQKLLVVGQRMLTRREDR
jgi:hypothetical protein